MLFFQCGPRDTITATLQGKVFDKDIESVVRISPTGGADGGEAMMIHRLADLPPLLRGIPEGAGVVAESHYRGAVLARLIDTTGSTWPDRPLWPDH